VVVHVSADTEYMSIRGYVMQHLQGIGFQGRTSLEEYMEQDNDGLFGETKEVQPSSSDLDSDSEPEDEEDEPRPGTFDAKLLHASRVFYNGMFFGTEEERLAIEEKCKETILKKGLANHKDAFMVVHKTKDGEVYHKLFIFVQPA
jgi:hypothetical protein